tara:strand:+ start:855 stop:1121 length:267 start_codon:yes stop_codon:yes gene_type:complete
MSDKIIINTTEGPVETDPIFKPKDALFMRPYATPVQVTEAIKRAHREVINRYEEIAESENLIQTLEIILEFHLDDVLGHGEEPAFTGE